MIKKNESIWIGLPSLMIIINLFILIERLTLGNDVKWWPVSLYDYQIGTDTTATNSKSFDVSDGCVPTVARYLNLI